MVEQEDQQGGGTHDSRVVSIYGHRGRRVDLQWLASTLSLSLWKCVGLKSHV